MQKRIGWLVAALMALAWISSGRNDPPGPERLAATVRKERIAAVPSPAVALPPPAPEMPPLKPAPAPPATSKLSQTTTLYTSTKVNMRAAPSTTAAIVATLEPGAAVSVGTPSGLWFPVTRAGKSGWIRYDFLIGGAATVQKAAPVEPAAPSPPKPQPPTAFYSPITPAKPRSLTPLRDPYVGTCDCPYDRKRNGAMCGGSSAYSRPGGRNPACYL
ncbi:SH3 domain-containing protein [Flaviflagellibacter deserti]|uniref:SH3 domain-containing protein n=1 Tax=Flaviflagellibacter deserti TaxID=2267266 RepID=A0ABV9Z7S4_9HYPH